ncbi:MAG: LCP family protein [Anaerolineae bacterium]|nr:LCP family protein [Anaerolineae bacterium]
MATHSKSYQPVVIPPWLTQGLVVGMVFLFLLGGAYTGYLFYFVVKNTVKELAARTNLPTVPYVELALPLGALPLTGDENAPIPLPVARGGETGQTGVTGVPLPDYERKERVNILLLGIDRRPDEVYARTDTMILVTVDPNSKTAGMLSVPRDLYVSIPGFDEDRINKAHFLGDQHGYPGGGPALAMKTIQYNLGVPVHFYVKVDFEGFRNIVDTLGGIDIDVPETINDPKYPDNNYGYDPFYIEAGRHTLNGYDALRYARTRATVGVDFDRAKRQQQVLLAIRDKALQLDMIPKIPELWSTMAGTVETNLQLVDIVELAQLADEIDTNNIQTAVIDVNMTIDYIVPDTRAQVLLPLREKIRAVVDEMFAESEPAPPAEGPAQQAEVEAAQTAQTQARAEEIEQQAQLQQEIKEFLRQEDARLVVQNGTNVPNLASQTALYLKQQGFNIIQFGPADTRTYSHTVIVVYNESKTYTLQVLTALFAVTEENIRRSPNLKSDLDFRVIIGSDFELSGGSQPLLTTEE